MVVVVVVNLRTLFLCYDAFEVMKSLTFDPLRDVVGGYCLKIGLFLGLRGFCWVCYCVCILVGKLRGQLIVFS